MKVFGREPTAIVGAVQVVLALLLSFGWLSAVGLDSQDDLAVVVAVVSAGFAAYLAYVTSETLLAPVVELLKASLALAAIYGLTLTTEQTGLLVATVSTLFTLWHRERVTPLDSPTFAYIGPDDTGTPRAQRPPATA